MIIGVPQEVKNSEYRVAITPAGVQELRQRDHTALIQTGAGLGSGISDADYVQAGATLCADPDELWGQAHIILKVKEPVASEYHRFRPGLVLFTFLHLAAEPELTAQLLSSRVTAIAYETVQSGRNLPLLAPMSEVAGRLSVQVGAQALTKPAGGKGVLLAGVPGVRPAQVVVLGAGVAGSSAVAMAVGLGAEVSVLDLDIYRLRALDDHYRGRVKTICSTSLDIEKSVLQTDLVVGSVLIPGDRAPKLVPNTLVARMKPGSVLVDIAIDQGGCFADSRPTTHGDPTFTVHDTLFYCVTNMPGAVPNTSTYGLTNVTLPYVCALADRGVAGALEHHEPLAAGLNTVGGHLTNPAVGQALDLPTVPDWRSLVGVDC